MEAEFPEVSEDDKFAEEQYSNYAELFADAGMILEESKEPQPLM